MNEQQIQALIDRFFDGETTPEEESRLYAYFSRPGLPAVWEPYRPVFLGLKAISLPAEAMLRPRRKPRWTRLAIGIAVSLLLFFGAATAWNRHAQRQLQSQYAGSYMIINGRKIVDLNRMKPEIERTLADAEAIEKQLANQK